MHCLKSLYIIFSILLFFLSCGGVSGKVVNNNGTDPTGDVKIIFLHHSTGQCIWNGGVPSWFTQYNSDNSTDYYINEQAFPKSSPYGWNNYPYDYWNIWVNNAGSSEYQEEPTLEILTSQYDVIIWKHCFPVSSINADTGSPDITSSTKSIENYKLQYNALKSKMHEFPSTKFIVWTGAVQVESQINSNEATRMQSFVDWIKNTWDEKEDNIYIWDFYALETEGGLYLKSEFASSSSDSHPNSTFSNTVAPYFCTRITNVIKGIGDSTSLTGK